MNKYLDIIIAVFGWAMFSLLAHIALSLIFEIIGVNFWDGLSIEIKIIASLVIGYCFWFPHWDKRIRG